MSFVKLLFSFLLEKIADRYFYQIKTLLKYFLNELFLFRYPINCEVINFAGILTIICIWSLHTFAFIISTPLFSHPLLNIAPTASFIFHKLFVFYTWGSIGKMQISHVKSIFPYYTKGLETFYKLFLYSFNNL